MLSLENAMNETLPSEACGGVAGALGTLRHALADPLSAAGLKLELVDRRLVAGNTEPTALAERVRGAKADIAAASRLVDLLPRLASIAGEVPRDVSLGDVCRAAGMTLEQDDVALPSLRLRRLASVDSLRTIAELFRSQDPDRAPPRVRADLGPGQVTLTVEGPGASGLPRPERLFHLPRGEERAAELFLARACVESDGGRIDLDEREGRLVAILSWPRPSAPGDAVRAA